MAAIVALLLLIDVHAAYITDNQEAQQSVARSSATPAPLGRQLNVYIAGDRTLAGQLRQHLPEAIKVKDLPLQVTFVDQIPANSNETPFLGIHVGVDGGFWTPVFATRHVQATLLYSQGRPVDSQEVLTGQAKTTHAFSPETCVGDCSDGSRQIKLNARALGLVSLPYMRSYAAAKVAEQAAMLVANGLPEHLNPAKWNDRAFAQVKEKLGGSGTWTSFQRIPGCWGGAGMGGSARNNSLDEWVVFYYDAERDQITETVTSKDVAAKTLVPYPTPGAGQQPLVFGLPNGKGLIIPPGTCGLTGWQVTGP